MEQSVSTKKLDERMNVLLCMQTLDIEEISKAWFLQKTPSNTCYLTTAIDRESYCMMELPILIFAVVNVM